jgi:hypothetical protein
MIEVRIRHDADNDAVRIFDWDPADMDGAVRALMSQGVRDGEGNHYAAADSFRSEIVYDAGEAYLEIVFGLDLA